MEMLGNQPQTRYEYVLCNGYKVYVTNEYECDNTKLNSHETFKTHKL